MTLTLRSTCVNTLNRVSSISTLEKIYERYNERTAKVNKTSDQFYSMMNKIDLNEEDKKFDMIKPVENGLNVEDFMKQFETK